MRGSWGARGRRGDGGEEAADCGVPVTRFARRVRRGLKEPVQAALAWAAVRLLDVRPRTLDDLRALEPRAIVASRTDRIGDLLCGTPLLAALHRRWPSARLVVIPGPKNRAVLAGLPFVEAGPTFGREPLSWYRVRAWLHRQRFDLAVSLCSESMAGVYVSAWSRAPIRAATHPEKTRSAHNLFFGPDDYHQLTRYCRCAELLGFPCETTKPVFVVPAADERRGRETAAALRGAGPLVGVQIPNRVGGTHRRRAWPLSSIVDLVRGLAASGVTVVLCGVGPEVADAERVREAVPASVVCPRLALTAFAGLQRQFALFISSHTGTLHLADAVGTPTVGYGSRDKQAGWGLVGEHHRAVTAEDVGAIPVAAVLDAARAALGQGGAAGLPGARRPG